MTSYECTLLEATGHGQGTRTSIGAGQGEEVECFYDGLLQITYTCPTPGCNSPSTESYGLIQYRNPESRQNCRSIQLVDAFRNDLCDLHRATEGFAAIDTTHGAEQCHLHIIYSCPEEGCITPAIHSHGAILPYCDLKSGEIYKILGQVEVYQFEMCVLHRT
jgi:hypothetical protein